MNTPRTPRKNYRNYRRNQRGNALVWYLLAGVLGAVGVAYGVQQYMQGERNTSSGATASEVQAIIGEVKSNYGQYGYTGLTTGIAVGGNVIPRRLATGAATANNKYSGAITLVDNNATTQGTALLTYANVPQLECKSIVIGSESLARQVQVAGVDVKPLDGTLDIGALNTQCISANAVAVAWTIGRT